MVGVLALQGDFYKHKSILDKLEVNNIYVKNFEDLKKTNALIIPGGESSVLSMLIDRYSLRDSLIEYSQSFSIFGTCAGMIMMSKTKGLGHNVEPLNIMDFTISRNSWGPQINSFEKEVNLIELIPIAALVGVMFMVVIGTFAWNSLRLLTKVPKSDAIVIISKVPVSGKLSKHLELTSVPL